MSIYAVAILFKSCYGPLPTQDQRGFFPCRCPQSRGKDIRPVEAVPSTGWNGVGTPSPRRLRSVSFTTKRRTASTSRFHTSSTRKRSRRVARLRSRMRRSDCARRGVHTRAVSCTHDCNLHRVCSFDYRSSGLKISLKSGDKRMQSMHQSLQTWENMCMNLHVVCFFTFSAQVSARA